MSLPFANINIAKHAKIKYNKENNELGKRSVAKYHLLRHFSAHRPNIFIVKYQEIC